MPPPPLPHPRTTRLPVVDAARCTGCGRCVGACDLHLLSLQVRGWDKAAELHDPQRCTGCAACFTACPFHAISMRPRATAVAPAASSGRIGPDGGDGGPLTD